MEESLSQRLRDYLQSEGAHKVGYADLRDQQDELTELYGEAWQPYPYAVSVAVDFPRAIVNQVAEGPTLTYVRYYEALNAQLDQISYRAAVWLEAEGYQAYPVPASQRAGETHLCGIFSHRIAARLAGLGWIGKSCSLITPDRGPRQRLCTILTDAPLDCGVPLEPRCGKCRQCVEICPVEALKGQNWQQGQPLEERLDAQKCDALLIGIRKSFGKSVCGRCLAVCPVGKRGEKHDGRAKTDTDDQKRGLSGQMGSGGSQ